MSSHKRRSCCFPGKTGRGALLASYELFTRLAVRHCRLSSDHFSHDHFLWERERVWSRALNTRGIAKSYGIRRRSKLRYSVSLEVAAFGVAKSCGILCRCNELKVLPRTRNVEFGFEGAGSNPARNEKGGDMEILISSDIDE